jgi:hypothetical protein
MQDTVGQPSTEEQTTIGKHRRTNVIPHLHRYWFSLSLVKKYSNQALFHQVESDT